MSQYRMARREVSIPEEDSDSGGSDVNETENVAVETKRRPSRISFSKLWKFSVLSVSPSPRVSTIDGPLSLYGKEELTQSLRTEKGKVRLCCVAFSILLVITIISTALTIYLATRSPNIPYCTNDENVNVASRDQTNPDVFDDMTMSEYDAVTQYLLNYHHLGLTVYENASLTDSYIFLIELHLPDKEETVQYLDKESKQPDRKARVVIYRGSLDPPIVEEYLVFPLPEPREAVLYRDPAYRRHPVPFNSRPMDSIEYKYLYNGIVSKLTEELYPLLMQSYNLCYHNCSKGQNCMDIIDVQPWNRQRGNRKSWMSSFRSVDGFYIHPLGLDFLINHESKNTSTWCIESIIYNGQEFKNASLLMEAFWSEELVLLHVHPDNKQYNAYSSMEARDPIPANPKQGPFLFEPEGKRFSVYGQRVEYHKWSFSYHVRPSTGLMLFDVKFNQIRIAYEISVQEVLVFHTGFGPASSTVSNFDISQLLGSSTVELVRGVDCPDSAVFLDTVIWTRAGKAERIHSNVCVFENNDGRPLRRHFAKNKSSGYDFYGGIANYHLVVRSIATVMNYDYIFDYKFYANGAIEVLTSVTGYVQGTFRLPEEERYGSIIHNHVIANVHQHVVHYKVDLDIAGARNRYSTLKLRLASIEDPWMNGFNKTQIQMKQILNFNETRNSNYDFENHDYHLINNKDAKDAFGTVRAYRILNKSPVSVLSADDPISASYRWAKYPLVITKRKDTEQISTSIYAMKDPLNPVLNFEDYLDGDGLVDEDLVAWVTVGSNHVPGTEDIPGTPTIANQMSFILSPHNYFNECPSINSADNVFIRPSVHDNTVPDVDTYGRSYSAQCVPKVHGPHDFEGTRD